MGEKERIGKVVIEFRPEKGVDRKSICDLHLIAFGRRVEPELVNKIRSSKNFIPELFLVAISEKKIVGHILFSLIAVKTEEGEMPVHALAVISVLPKFQSKGIGEKLVKSGLEECRRLGHNIVFVVDHPSYYPRFGFVPASGYALSVLFEVPDEAFMAAELSPGALNGISGTVHYPPEFNEE